MRTSSPEEGTGFRRRDGRGNAKRQIVSYLCVAERKASSDFEYTLDCGHVAKRRIGYTIHGAWMHPAYVRCTECP